MTSWIRYVSPQRGPGFGLLDEAGLIHEHEGDMFDGPTATGARLSLSEVTLLSPCRPGKVVALWNNFHALAAKIGKAVPSHPLFLIKSSTSVCGDGEPIRRPASYGGKIAYEGELGIVIGRTCRHVAPDAAASHIFGYTCVNDVTAIELLNEDANFAQWTRAKSFDTFGVLGPVIVPDFDWRSASVVTTLDGVERQNYPLSDLVFGPETLVSLLSQDMTLEPGDVIACGTSLGVGSMKAGAAVMVTIAGIGTLANVMAG
jgi:2-keto-4-pentenoate hydratase/2-oxohepta-3-ene-1,7-dioic acid hydratase in catechol pathway